MKAHVAAFFRTTPLSCMFYNTSGGRHTRFKCDWSSDVCSSDLVSSAQTKTHTRPAEETPAAGDVSARYSIRSEERRVGKEGRSRWSPYQLKIQLAEPGQRLFHHWPYGAPGGVREGWGCE